jgi:hypothetical protein
LIKFYYFISLFSILKVGYESRPLYMLFDIPLSTFVFFTAVRSQFYVDTASPQVLTHFRVVFGIRTQSWIVQLAHRIIASALAHWAIEWPESRSLRGTLDLDRVPSKLSKFLIDSKTVWILFKDKFYREI